MTHTHSKFLGVIEEKGYPMGVTEKKTKLETAPVDGHTLECVGNTSETPCSFYFVFK